MQVRPKIVAAYVFAIPLALILGILAASPDEISFVLLGLLLFFLAMPLFIKWHHAMLIVFWNSVFCAFFLPGQPQFWLFFTGLSFGISLLNHVMGRKPFISVPEMTRPVLFLLAVVLGTAYWRGGIGLKLFGGMAHGGKYYIYIIAAIMGYFAFTGGRIPVAKSSRMATLYFLSGTTALVSNLAYTLGPAFYFVFYLVPAGVAAMQAASDFGLTEFARISGLGPASIAALVALLAHYGIRGLFVSSKPWRMLLLCAIVGASCFAGFRTILLTLFLIFAIQFCLEGLLRTRLFLILSALALMSLIALALFATKLPMSVQRTVSFLPISVDASVRADAMGSSEWRYQMWSVVWKQVPKYLLIGKGYAFDPVEMDSTIDAIRMGLLGTYEEAMLAGDYHSGPLSIIIPFGLLGVAGFLWVLIAGGRVLYFNFRYGEPKLRRVNSVLFSFYLANVVTFFFAFGAFNTQLAVFLGAVGMSVSLNGGVKRKSKLATDRERGFVTQAYAMELR